jgi:hypothetical protein
MARIRSPNYPTMSLPAAIDKVGAIHKAEGQNSVDRETVAKLIGFGGVNGASATALSALAKYGLLEASDGKEARVTDLAVKILYPESGQEKATALLEAANRPALFRQIKEKWPERPPSDDNLRGYLVRTGFNQGSVEQVIQIYRNTLDIVGGANGEHNAPDEPKEATVVQTHNPQNTPTGSMVKPPVSPEIPQLAPSRPFAVSFDGTVLRGTIAITKIKDIDRLMKVLAAQKAAFEAMEEDDFDDVASTSDDDNSDALAG